MIRTATVMTRCTAIRGFSLIELLVTIALAGVMASIAYPSYRQSVLRTHRTDARVELSTTAHALEKCFTHYATYDSPSCTAAAPFLSGKAIVIAGGRFQISGTIGASTFTLTATAKNAQSADSACGTMSLTDTNVRSPAACW